MSCRHQHDTNVVVKPVWKGVEYEVPAEDEYPCLVCITNGQEQMLARAHFMKPHTFCAIGRSFRVGVVSGSKWVSHWASLPVVSMPDRVTTRRMP